jgi:hypothetical protein
MTKYKIKKKHKIKNINENKKSFSFISDKDNFTSDFHTFLI